MEQRDKFVIKFMLLFLISKLNRLVFQPIQFFMSFFVRNEELDMVMIAIKGLFF